MRAVYGVELVLASNMTLVAEDKPPPYTAHMGRPPTPPPTPWLSPATQSTIAGAFQPPCLRSACKQVCAPLLLHACMVQSALVPPSPLRASLHTHSLLLQRHHHPGHPVCRHPAAGAAVVVPVAAGHHAWCAPLLVAVLQVDLQRRTDRRRHLQLHPLLHAHTAAHGGPGWWLRVCCLWV